MLAIRKNETAASGQQGFTLVEVTIILLVLVILGTIMLPQMGNFNRLARYVKVTEDLGAICATMKKFLDEVMVPGPFANPGADPAGGAAVAPDDPIGLLVGPGNPPTAITAACTVGAGTAGDWDQDLSTDTGVNEFECETDIGTAADVTFLTDELDHHLQENNPLGGAAGVTTGYKSQAYDITVGPFFGWRGPYFNEITADPWGGRYSVNTYGLHADPTNGGTYSTAVICISFGPNLAADTAFELPHPSGYTIGGDDIAVVLSAMGPF